MNAFISRPGHLLVTSSCKLLNHIIGTRIFSEMLSTIGFNQRLTLFFA